MTKVPRFHAGPAVAHPREALRAAFIVWDARMWNGMTNNAIIPNLGSAGSAFDLEVTAGLSNPATTMVGAVSTPGDWDLIDGPPCDGPFTFMFVREWPARSGGSGNDLGTASLSWPNTGLGNASLRGGSTMFAGLGGTSVGRIFSPSTSPGPNIASRFHTVTIDPVDGGSTYWYDLTPTNPSLRDVSVPDDCQDAADALTGNMLGAGGGTRGWKSLPQDGLGWIGYVAFRGEPTDADITYWKTYFDTPLPPDPFLYTLDSFYDTPAPGSNFTTRRAWYDGTYCYHWLETFVNSTANSFKVCSLTPVPGATLPSTIDFILVGAGENVAGRISGTPSRSGGGGGGEVIEVLGHTAPVASTDFTLGGLGIAGHALFEGYQAIGKPSGTNYTFRGPNGGDSLDGVNAGGTGTVAFGGGGGGAGGVGGNATGSAAGDGGDGILSDWHWSATPQHHGGGGPGSVSPNSDWGDWQEPRGLGWGARGTSVTTPPNNIMPGGPAGLIIRYAY